MSLMRRVLKGKELIFVFDRRTKWGFQCSFRIYPGSRKLVAVNHAQMIAPLNMGRVRLSSNPRSEWMSALGVCK